MPVVAQLSRGVKPLVDLIYPPRCPLCGAALAGQDGLCGDCWGLLDIPEGGTQHASAPDHSGRIVPVHAATYYNDASRRLVLAYKHGGRIALAHLLARLMAARLPDPAQNCGPPLLVPVPLHRWRLWQRGFNQAALLTRELAGLGKGEAMVDGLERRKRTPSLGGLGREARERALTGAITANRQRITRIAGRDVVLVDDVFTSGATARACIEALGQAGARSVAVACFARVDDADSRDHFDKRGVERASGYGSGVAKNETPEAL